MTAWHPWRWLHSLLLLAIGLGNGMTSASAEERASLPAKVPTFADDILPILQAKCFRCHGEQMQKGELTLHTPAGILKGGESGEILVAGKAAESRLYELVSSGEMPPDKKNPLSAAEVEVVRRWIDGGAKLPSDAATAARKITQHDVVPILLLRCTACHGRNKQEGGLDLRSRAAILKGGKSGPAAIAGKPDESLMVKRIRGDAAPATARCRQRQARGSDGTENN
jgi:cytochrome c553